MFHRFFLSNLLARFFLLARNFRVLQTHRSLPIPSRTRRDARKHDSTRLSAKYPYFRVIKATQGVLERQNKDFGTLFSLAIMCSEQKKNRDRFAVKAQRGRAPFGFPPKGPRAQESRASPQEAEAEVAAAVARNAPEAKGGADAGRVVVPAAAPVDAVGAPVTRVGTLLFLIIV